MNDRETRRYDMFGRVQTFGKDITADDDMESDDQSGVASTAAIDHLAFTGSKSK